MSRQTERELRAHICDRCWRTTSYRESGVTADLRGSWKILLLDKHFSRCVSQNRRLGELCDGVAVYPQNQNRRLRFIELKQSLRDLPKAVSQLRKGAETTMSKLPSRFVGLTVEAELHVRKAATSTAKVRETLDIGGRKIPLRAFRNGRRV